MLHSFSSSEMFTHFYGWSVSSSFRSIPLKYCKLCKSDTMLGVSCKTLIKTKKGYSTNWHSFICSVADLTFGLQVQLAVQSLINQHQQIPGNIMRALFERFHIRHKRHWAQQRGSVRCVIETGHPIGPEATVCTGLVT